MGCKFRFSGLAMVRMFCYGLPDSVMIWDVFFSVRSGDAGLGDGWAVAQFLWS